MQQYKLERQPGMLDSFYVDSDGDTYYINNEQGKLVCQYREEWQDIAFSIARIDRDRSRCQYSKVKGIDYRR